MFVLFQIAAALTTGVGAAVQRPPVDVGPRSRTELADVAWAPASLPVAAADTGRPRVIEYSDGYGVRLTIHRYASYAMIPLFVAEYFSGRDLLQNNSAASSFARNFHRPLATAIGGLFVLNTVTGVWNLVESRHDPAGKTRRIIHSVLMLTADAGFAATGIVASRAHNSASARSLHQTIAVSSMSVALAGDLLMLIWKD